MALLPSQAGPVQVKPRGWTTFPHRYDPASVPLSKLRSIFNRARFVHGLTALHWKLATRPLESLVVPTSPSTTMSRIWNSELVQLPLSGAPENCVHCEMVTAPPRRPLARRFPTTRSLASREMRVPALEYFQCFESRCPMEKQLTSLATATSIWRISITISGPSLEVELCTLNKPRALNLRASEGFLDSTHCV